jgi:hypothetical protein
MARWMTTQPARSRGRRRRSSRPSSAIAPSRSLTSAAVSCTANNSPRVSTSTWRLRPLTFLAPS